MYVVNAYDIYMDEDNVQAIRDWPTPKTVSECGVFMALQRFIRGLSEIPALLLHLSLNV